MKHLKLFEEISIEESEFPENGHNLSIRESKILTDLVGETYLNRFTIKVDDHLYYTRNNSNNYCNSFDDFNDLKEYLLSRYYISNNKPEEYMEFLKTSKIDSSFDNNVSITWACDKGYMEIVKHLLNDPRVDPSVDDNYPIKLANLNGYTEIVKLLLDDKRVRSKLPEWQINKYINGERVWI